MGTDFSHLTLLRLLPEGTQRFDSTLRCKLGGGGVGQGHTHSKIADDSAPYVCNLPILLNSRYLPENTLFHPFLRFGSISME